MITFPLKSVTNTKNRLITVGVNPWVAGAPPTNINVLNNNNLIGGVPTTANVCPSMMLTCIDFRFHDNIIDDLANSNIFYMNGQTFTKMTATSFPTWMNLRTLASVFSTDKYDEMIFAGASLGYNTSLNWGLDDKDTYSSSKFHAGDADPDINQWARTFNTHIDIAILLHGIQNVIIIDHMECGAYKAFYSSKYASPTTSKDIFIAPHLVNMDRSQKLIAAYYDNVHNPYKTTDAGNHALPISITWTITASRATATAITAIMPAGKTIKASDSGVPLPTTIISSLTANSAATIAASLTNINLASPPTTAIPIAGTPYELCNVAYPANNATGTVTTTTTNIRRKPLQFYYFIMDTDGNLVSYDSSLNNDRNDPNF